LSFFTLPIAGIEPVT